MTTPDPKALRFHSRLHGVSDETPTVSCPRCGATHEDYDGAGFVAHTRPEYIDGCGYCSHPMFTAGVCTICGVRYEVAYGE